MHLGGTDYLLVGLRETQTYHYKLVLFNPLTLWYLPLNLFFEGIELSCLGSCEVESAVFFLIVMVLNLFLDLASIT